MTSQEAKPPMPNDSVKAAHSIVLAAGENQPQPARTSAAPVSGEDGGTQGVGERGRGKTRPRRPRRTTDPRAQRRAS